MDKTPKKSAGKDASNPSQKPVLSPKPKLKTTTVNTTKNNQDATHDVEVDNNSDEIFAKRERSLSDGSVKSLSWGASEPVVEQSSPSHPTAKRTRSNTTNKEMWVPLAKTEKVSKPVNDTKTDKPSSPEPVKPPRPKRVNSFKHSNEEKPASKAKPKSKPKGDASRTEIDPIKPPRRKLPQAPRDSPEREGRKEKKSKPKKDEELRDVVSRPIVTSTPFQENMTLSVEDLDGDGSGRRMFSIYDDTTESTVQQGQSFYDFLYSTEDPGSSQAGALSGSHIKDLGDDNIYDEVPLESSTQSLASLGKRNSNNGFDIYDEVIINKEYYMMPVDDTDDLSDWGSDFDDDDDDDFDNIEVIDDDNVRYDKQDDNDGNASDSGSGSYEEYKNSSAVFYATERSTPPPRRKPGFKLRNGNNVGGKKFNKHVNIPGLKGIKGCFGITKTQSLPYLASPKSKDGVQDEDDEAQYVDPNIADTDNYQQPVMPDMAQGLSSVQIKRHQIVKFILESETDYMKLLDKLIKQYELPIKERDLLEPSKIDTIFQGVHKVLDCHVMFNIALSGRMTEWNTEEKIGDILYALFSKSMVLEAYSSYVNNFAKAMDTVKSACKTHLAFAQLLKARREACRERVTLHSLMLKPTKRFPQFIDLVQELLKVTPIEHPDRIPLQMALTQLEYLADNLNERRREAELRQKVKLLDASTAHISKPLSSGNRYFIRQDDFVQCVIEDDTVVRTKKQRIIMLSDMLLCVSAIKGKKDRMANLITDVKAKYKLKWNVPLCDVEVIEYGPGINMYAAPPKTNLKQAKEGQYQQHTGCQEHFADLQHDLAVIGQIAGLVATLRRSYQILDNDKVQKWHKAIQRTIEEESRLANMYWLELSLPAKTGRVNYIFSTDSPSVKAEWLTALNTAVLRLGPENNPGWYLPEDNGTGEVAIQRRNMPLLKDNIDLFLLNPKARVQSIVTCPDVSNPLPGIHDNYNNLWLLCGGPDSTGFVNVIRVSCASPPQIVESFHVSDSQILCGEFVERTCLEDKKVSGPLSGKFGFPFPTVWLGTQSGKIYIYNGIDSERRYVMSVKLPDAVFALKAVKRKVFASLGDGSLVVFKPNKDGIWDFSKPKAIGLSKLAVTSMALVAGTLWCGSGNSIHIFDHKNETVKYVIEVDSNAKTTIYHLVCYGIGVWVSLWKQPTIKLYHSETMEHVQDMNIAYTVNTMQKDIDSQFEKTKLNKLYVSCMVAEEGLLWVGTSVGLVLIFPLPRLEGIPLVSGRACVSFHAYQGRVRSLCPLKNNPDAEVTIGPASANKKRYQLFREHVTRDACVQTDARNSGMSSYVANGPEPARRASDAKSCTNKQEGEDDDDVHSDEEFNFVDEKQNYIHPTGSPPNTSPNLSVTFTQGTDKSSTIGANTLTNQIPELGDTDFVKMMEDFQGFGSLPKTSIPDPPDISAVLITKDVPNELKQSEKTGDDLSTPADHSPKNLDNIRDFSDNLQDKKKVDLLPTDQNINTGIRPEGEVDTTGIRPEGEGTTPTFRGRMESQGQYVMLEDAQKEAKAIGESLDAATKQLNGSDVKGQNTEELQPGSDVTQGSPPSYISLINSSPNTTRVFDSDSDNEATRSKDASYSVFSDSTSAGVQSPEEKKKVTSLKPKLPFPVMLVTAGEGHSDLRRKKQDVKNTDPRIMIWQIS